MCICGRQKSSLTLLSIISDARYFGWVIEGRCVHSFFYKNILYENIESVKTIKRGGGWEGGGRGREKKNLESCHKVKKMSVSAPDGLHFILMPMYFGKWVLSCS